MESNLAGGIYQNGTTRCDILDLDDPESHWAGSREEETGIAADEYGNRWLVICPHGSLVSTPHLDMARWLAAHPAEFCYDHR